MVWDLEIPRQDLLGFVHLIPDSARQRILDIAATQFEDGSAYHQYQPLTKKGNSDIGSGFNDDPLWLIAGTAAYLKETGDFSILDENVAFDCDTSKAQPLMEHLKKVLPIIQLLILDRISCHLSEELTGMTVST